MKETLGKMKSIGNLTNAADVPSFKPNPLENKSLMDRMKCGFDFQITKSDFFYPCNIRLGGELGFQLLKKLVTGVGVTYTLNLGEGWNRGKIKPIDNGFRSFIDYQYKKNIYFEFTVERNLKNTSPPSEIVPKRIKIIDSALAGIKFKKPISKKISISSSLLFDFMYSEHNPSTSPLVYRIGFGI